MNWFKRFNARKFNIQPEDLPVRDQASYEQIQLTPPDAGQQILVQSINDNSIPAPTEESQQQVLKPEEAKFEEVEPSYHVQDETAEEDEFPLIEEGSVSPIVRAEAETLRIPDSGLMETPLHLDEVEIHDHATVEFSGQSRLQQEEVLPLEDIQVSELSKKAIPGWPQ